MRDSVPSASYSSVCNVLRQWNIRLIPTYRVYRLYVREKVIVNPLRRLALLTIIAKCLHACMQWIPQLIITACAIPDIIIHYDP